MSRSEPFVPTSYPGILHHYTKGLTAFEFDGPALKSSGKPATVLFVGGLGDNLLTVPYVHDLLRTGWSIVQVLLSSAAGGWGTGSLHRDAKELALCISYFKIQLSRPRVVLMGHSTGCQDVMEYLSRLDVSQQANGLLDGAILQAPVSDREALVMIMGQSAYDRSWKHAQKMVKAGKGEDIMPSQITQNIFDSPCTASRWYSLTSPLHDGADDFFSSDTPMENLEATFGAITPARTPLLILYSGADEFTPPSVDKKALVDRWVDVCRRNGVAVDAVNSGVIAGATHNFAGCGDAVTADFLGRVGRFLDGVVADGKVGAGGGLMSKV
ncbi:hypothetical protein TWF696_009189 [Orbilia brochopaga]|uniref:DUF1749-domain-containing protein n=1 Tax=Orbilia brochopaga TaxID=3140254 RepID=A0AAV9UI19_9PEZI